MMPELTLNQIVMSYAQLALTGITPI